MRNTLELATQRNRHTVSLRREFHMYPELSFKEFQTAERIRRELDRIGIPYRAVTETGTVAEIQCAKPGKTIALRADIDALEILEETGLEYASKNTGVMHACGHDAHTAALLCAGDILYALKEELAGTVKLIFQPGEERVQGAPRMMAADPFMEDVDRIFSMHVFAGAPAGQCFCRNGGLMFAGEFFQIDVTGKGGHGAQPHQAVDALLVASQIVVASQAILGREINPLEPAVCTIGELHSGTRHNIMAETARMSGTIRCYNEETRQALRESLNRIAEDTAKAFRAKATVTWDMYVPPVVNDAQVGKQVMESAAKVLGAGNVKEATQVSSSDDFAYFLQKTPGYYMFLGCGYDDPAKNVPVHNPRFTVNEDCLPLAAAIYAQYALDELAE